jgi:hypothetical protein
MSNHFPSVPGDLELFEIKYSTITNLPSYSGTGWNVQAPGDDDQVSVQVQFSTPGTFGDFDQDAFEADLFAIFTAYCQMQADGTGQTLAEVQAELVINRTWVWINEDSSAILTLNDHPTFP